MRRFPESLTEVVRTATSLVVATLAVLILLAPAVSSAIEVPRGINFYVVSAQEDPTITTDHATLVPYGFGDMIRGQNELRWYVETLPPLGSVDTYACVTIADQIDDILCFDREEGIHSFNAEGLVPFESSTRRIGSTVIELFVNTGQGPTLMVDFIFAVVPAGRDPLTGGDVAVWMTRLPVTF